MKHFSRMISVFLCLVLLPLFAFAEGTEWRCPTCGYWATGEECSECGAKKPDGTFIYLGKNSEYGIILSDGIQCYSRYAKDGDGSEVTKNEMIDFIFQHEPECNAIITNDKYTIWAYYYPVDNRSLTQSEKIIRCMNMVFPGNAQFLMRDFIVFPYDPAVFEIYQINPVGEEGDLSYVEYFFILLENGVIVYTGSAVNDMDIYFFMFDLAYNTIAPEGNPYIKE